MYYQAIVATPYAAGVEAFKVGEKGVYALRVDTRSRTLQVVWEGGNKKTAVFPLERLWRLDSEVQE